MKHKLIDALKLTTLAALLTAGVAYGQSTWQGPSNTFPNNNAPAPINVSATAQTKEGNLTINGGLLQVRKLVNTGPAELRLYNAGNVAEWSIREEGDAAKSSLYIGKVVGLTATGLPNRTDFIEVQKDGNTYIRNSLLKIVPPSNKPAELRLYNNGDKTEWGIRQEGSADASNLIVGKVVGNADGSETRDEKFEIRKSGRILARVPVFKIVPNTQNPAELRLYNKGGVTEWGIRQEGAGNHALIIGKVTGNLNDGVLVEDRDDIITINPSKGYLLSKGPIGASSFFTTGMSSSASITISGGAAAGRVLTAVDSTGKAEWKKPQISISERYFFGASNGKTAGDYSIGQHDFCSLSATNFYSNNETRNACYVWRNSTGWMVKAALNSSSICEATCFDF